VYNILEEGGHTLLVVNPQHTKALPGRKTDVRDSEWLADLLRHGLLRGSFIPPAHLRALREVTRYRKTLVQERAQEITRLQKVLESANIKLAVVATDILGVSGRAMLEALANGQDDADLLAGLARGKLLKKLEALRLALEGRVKPHHRRLIRAMLQHIGYLAQAIAELDEEIAAALVPLEPAARLLRTIPAIGRTAAAAILAEIGADMGRFMSAKHLASWAGICPGNRQSGGKRLSGTITHGNVWLRGILGEVAWAAIRKKGSSFGARYRRLARRVGKQKAVVAVMHNLLIVIYTVLRTGQPYQELGPDYYQPGDPHRRQRRLVQGLEALGYSVTLAPKEAA
jgi:transposase